MTKEEEVMNLEEEKAQLLVHVVRQKKIPIGSEYIAIVAIDTKRLVQLGELLESHNTKAGTTVTDIIDVILNQPFN